MYGVESVQAHTMVLVGCDGVGVCRWVYEHEELHDVGVNPRAGARLRAE